MPWTQVYNPTGLEWLSTLDAAAPVIVLLGSLGILGWSAPKAAACGLITAIVVSIGVFGMPWQAAVAAAGYGACFGLFPIGWIVVATVFLYVLTVDAGEFEKVKASVVALSPDRRIQALLIAFCFGAFIEGGGRIRDAGGHFGSVAHWSWLPAAVCRRSYVDCQHRAGGVWGAWYTDHYARQSDGPARDAPLGEGWATVAALCAHRAGLDGLHDVGVARAARCVAGGVIAMAALAALLRIWRPGEEWQFPESTADETLTGINGSVGTHSRREIIRAWVPWVILSACVFLWGVPKFRTSLDGATARTWIVPHLHEQVQPDATVVGGEGKPKGAEFRFNWLSATGTGIMVAAILSAFWIGISPVRFVRLFLHTLHRLRWPLFTIAAMLAIAYTSQYSGTDVTLGLASTRTDRLYPFFAPLLGWLGVALTGSDTSSNSLFGNLQRVTAERLGLNPILICASNSTGGVMGKMIDAQSIVVASAATGQHGEEGRILRFVFWHSIAPATLVGVLTIVQAYLLPQMIPGN
jgi:lactate permease